MRCDAINVAIGTIDFATRSWTAITSLRFALENIIISRQLQMKGELQVDCCFPTRWVKRGSALQFSNAERDLPVLRLRPWSASGLSCQIPGLGALHARTSCKHAKQFRGREAKDKSQPASASQRHSVVKWSRATQFGRWCSR